MMRGLSSSLFPSLGAAAYGATYFRPRAAEFPLATQNVCDSWAFRGSRAADGVPSISGALRPLNPCVKTKHDHELLFLRETRAALARRLSTQRRQSGASGEAADESTKENVLAAIGCLFRKRQERKETRRRDYPQWRPANNTAGAQT